MCIKGRFSLNIEEGKKGRTKEQNFPRFLAGVVAQSKENNKLQLLTEFGRVEREIFGRGSLCLAARYAYAVDCAPVKW